MKRIFCVIFALITLSLVSIPLQTKTINTTRTQQIINGLQFDPIYNSYRDSYLRDSFDTLDFVEFQSETDPNRSAEFFQTTVYSNKATSAVFNYACSDVNVFLENSSRFLLDPTYVDYYDIDNVVLPYFIMPRFTSNDPDGYRKCLDLTYQLIHLSNVVDRVYWYYDAVVMSSMGYYNQISYQQALLEKLDVMANFAYRRIQNSIPTGNEADSTAIDYPNGILNTYPGAFWCADGDTTNDYLEFLVIDTNNYMIRMIGALGYAGVILGNQSYLNLVDNLLLTYSGDSNYQWVDEENNNGLLNLVIQKSGMYVEGLQYQNFALSNLFPYFTQRYYYDGFNYYENEIIKQMLKTSSEIMTPEYQFLALDDTLEHHLCHWGWLEYLQLGTDNDLKSSIEWCVNSLINNLPAINSSHVMNGTRDSVFLIESYNGYSVSTVDFPTSLTNGAYANSEVTILRNSVTTQQEFEDNLTVFVNHENSKNYSVHEQSDQNSFLLYYNKNDLLIDPGYYKQWRDGPTWWGWWHGGRLWLNSALAHNTLLFDEDLDNIYIAEQAHILNEYMTTTVYPPLPVVRPIDISSISNTTNTNDQAYRNYLSSANDIDISEIAINYDDLLLQHSRTFIRVDNESVIICDKVQNQSLTSYQFAPQLHFEEYNNTSSTQALSLSNNCFSYSSEHPDQYLYGSIGANTAATLAIHDNLPWGLNSDTTYRYHKALRLTTAATLDDAEFITILCPSDNSTSSILAEETSNIDAYGVKYDTNTIDSFESYTALKNSGTTFDFTVDQLRFNTNGKIFLTKANSTFSDFDKLAICNGNYLEVSDLTSSGFGNVSVFEGTDVDNVIATWADGNLEVVIKNDTAANPKYKVLRSSTDLENFTSKTVLGSEYPDSPIGPIITIEDNVEKLAFDDEYFYVNYSYNDLSSEGLLTSNVIIHSGTYESLTIQGTTQFGSGNLVLETNFIVPLNTEIVFLPESSPMLDNTFHIIISGSLSAIGDLQNNILFDNLHSEWNKFEVTSTGSASFAYCTFTNGQMPIYCKGELDVEHCSFTDNDSGIMLDKPVSYAIKDSHFEDCTLFGVFVKDSHLPVSESIIKNSYITNSNYGIWLYNASPLIEADTLYANNLAGIYATRGSFPIVSKSSISLTYSNSFDYPELKLAAKSYPFINENNNDIIFEMGNSIYNMDQETSEYNVNHVWWGTTNATNISNSFFPSTWDVDYNPFSLTPNVGYDPFPANNLLQLGLIAESEQDILTATNLYTQAINSDISESDALCALERLFNCYVSINNIDGIQLLMSDIQNASPNAPIGELTYLYDAYIDRILGNYETAIDKYTLILNNETSYIDSIFTELDLVYTYLDAESTSKSMSSVSYNGTSINSVDEAKQKEKELWSMVEANIKLTGKYNPEIVDIGLSNHPNPFNPTTTISFNLSEESDVELTIYNVKGQRIKTLIDDNLSIGKHSIVWEGKDKNNKKVGSGIYFYSLKQGNGVRFTRKCVLLK